MKIIDNTFVVTGGGNGIGREVVLELLRRGARVAALDVSEKGLAETASLAAAGERLTLHTLDITDRDAVAALPAVLAAVHPSVDGLINVAGIVHRFARVADLSFDEIERVMNVNFWGVVTLVKTFLPVLQARSEASLVNVSSMGALAPVPGQSAYGASKAAVKLLTEGLAAELRETPVAVTVVFPGGVGTDILGNSGVEMKRTADASGAGKLTSPADAGRQIVDAVAKGTPRVRIGSDARLLDRLSRLMPVRVVGLIADRLKGLLD